MKWETICSKSVKSEHSEIEDRFFLELSVNDEVSKLIARTLEARKVGAWKPGYNSEVFAAEWGYSFTHLGGSVDGMGREICKGYVEEPRTREEALQAAQSFLQAVYIKGAPHPWYAMNGHYPWHHYSGEFGFDRLGSEVGENINNVQWHIALNRGAAAQFNKPWFIDFSSWYGPGVLDYHTPGHWGEYSSPDAGHSISLFERAMYLSYMAGADEVVAESGGVMAVLDEKDEDGLLKLSPYGEACHRFNQFVQTNADVGSPVVPLALVIDRLHGMYPGFEGKKIFDRFPYETGDEMTWNVVDLLIPDGLEVQGKREKGYMVNAPFGDCFDVLVQTVGADVLGRYPIALLSGQLTLSAEEVEKLDNYVREGGTLLVNTAYLSAFPQWKNFTGEHTFGAGRVIVYGGDYEVTALREILSGLWDEWMPVQFSKTVEYSFNKKGNRVWMTLINNDGVEKDCRTPTEIDDSKAIDLTVTFRVPAPKQVTNLLDNTTETVSDGVFATRIEPGRVQIWTWEL